MIIQQKMTHHPDDATLLSFAAGSLPEPLALIIATHCSVCPVCAAEVKAMERMGAALFQELEPTSLDMAPPTMALRRMEADVVASTPRRTTQHSATADDATVLGEAGLGEAGLGQPVLGEPVASDVPQPLRHLIGDKLADIQWQRLGLGVWHAPVLQHKSVRGDVRLLRVEPGRAMPEHGHGGSELTMILSGSYQDKLGHFGPGDVADLDTDVEHRPVADGQTGCVCIIASEKQAVFKGFFARMIQPLTGI
jgi:putative transcriptional regulator